MSFYKKRQFIINFIYLIIWSLIVFIAFKFIFIYFLPFVLGIIISYLVQKPAHLISEKIKVNKRYCASILSVLLFITLIMILIILFRYVYLQSNNLIISLKNNKIINVKIFIKYLNMIFEKSNSDFDNTTTNLLIETIERILLNVSDFFSSMLSSAIKKLPNILLSVILTIVSTFYISKDYDKLKSFVLGLVNEKIFYIITKFKNVFIECFVKITIGYFFVYMITFFELLIGFSILKISNKLLLAFLISLIDVLPVLGTGTVLIPWAVFELLNNNYKFGIEICVLYVVIVIVRNIIEPKIIGKQTDINPIFTLLFTLLGFRLGGIVGMIFTPIILTVIFTYFRREISN